MSKGHMAIHRMKPLIYANPRAAKITLGVVWRRDWRGEFSLLRGVKLVGPRTGGRVSWVQRRG